MKLRLLFILLVFTPILGFSQLKRANFLYQQYRYKEAITSYLKVIRKHSDNAEALQKIANSYRKLKNYIEAEKYYAELIELIDTNAQNNFYYGQMLKSNGKIGLAKTQFNKYLNYQPNSLVGRLLLQSCTDVKTWQLQLPNFTIEEILELNTNVAEFNPIIYKNGIVFTSDRLKDEVNQSEFSWNNTPYLSIYYAQFTDSTQTELKKPKLFSSKINSNYHDGPACFTADYETIYFTRVEKKERGKKFVNRLKIFSAIIHNKKWKNIVPFQFNSDEYSVAHPSISEDGKTLYFSSDMPGTLGGMDIFSCQKNGTRWTTPVNLGSDVNTAANETFPHFKNGKLYFSSDGHSGYGGLDIYMVKKSENWKNPINLKAPLNSSSDDFGIYFSEDKKGYFSSNRPIELKGDNIFSFVQIKELDAENKSMIKGYFSYKNLPAIGKKIQLFDNSNTLIGTAITNEDGTFEFNYLVPDVNYLVKIIDEDFSILNESELFLINDDGKKILLLDKLKRGVFQFQSLPKEKYSQLPLMKLVEESFITGVFEYKNLPKVGIKIKLFDEHDNFIGYAITDSSGVFKFEHLDADKNYLVKIDAKDEQLLNLSNLYLLNEKGEKIQRLNKLLKGVFNFKALPPDQYEQLPLLSLEDEDLFTIGVDGRIYNKLPGDYSEKLQIFALDGAGNILATAFTDANGVFHFKNLSPLDVYLFKIQAEDSENLNLIIMDEHGNKLDKPYKMPNGSFMYSRLASDTEVLSLINEKDEEIIIGMNESFVIPNIYYEYQQYNINKNSANQLDKLVKIMQNNPDISFVLTSHTDSRGKRDYNMQLSQKRANSAIRYLVAHGAQSIRLKGIGYGETRLLNKCSDFKPCTEIEHAKNRRTEIKIKQ